MTAVSHHASLRWLQRVNPREPRPGERVLDALRRADRVERDDVTGEAYRDPETNTTLVVAPDGTVRTLWGGR
jgi:hypothetical protein